MPLMRNKSETHLYIATAGVKTTQKSVFFSKMKHVQNTVLQEDVLMFKGKETLFTWNFF